ncbi:MAG: hypothetical protein HYZ28_08090 [Myxococcales bacterium]|nr:hypothetical protein [Myxococcales bacterium]
MAVTFEQSLEKSGLPLRIGDVRLRYDTPVLVGQTDRLRSGVAPALSAASGVALALGAAGLLGAGGHPWAAGGLGLLAAVGLGAAVLLEARARRRRCFVVDFLSHTLRLDFTTPARGLPRTVVVTFDRVVSLDLLAHGDGQWALTVDFRPAEGPGELLREVLVAFARADEVEALRRLNRLLRGALGLPT